ncbi:MAG: sulfotransferase domain-containing protein [Pseudomonadota bacterium]
MARARNIPELFDLFRRTHSDECTRHWREMRVDPTDVFIATFAKSGTTWMQQIVHGLKTRGSMDFREISEVVPFIEVAWDCGIDLNAPQPQQPRAFKTHADAHTVPKGGRYIVVVRNPLDAAVSFYRFMDGWYLETGAVPVEAFVEELVLNGEKEDRYWSHLTSWWALRDRDDVRLYFFEDMKRNLEPVVRDVAAFTGIDLDDELLEIVLRQSSMEFMKAHEHRFDDNLLRDARDPVLGFPPGSESSKVNTGRVGGHKAVLAPEMIERFDEIWREEVLPVTGAETYDELRVQDGGCVE